MRSLRAWTHGMMRVLLFGVCLVFLVTCSTKNAATSYTADTAEEKARKALDGEDYPTAIEEYEKIVEADPSRYNLYPLLAAAYAGAAGIDLVNIVKAQFGNGSEGGGNLFDQLGNYVPSEPSDAQLESIRAAVNVLKSMPEAERDPSQNSNDYASAAAFQLTLYLAVSSAMNINKFVVRTDSGALDPEKLESMTDADVEAILGNLEDIVLTQTGGQTNEALSQQVDSTLAAINNQPGSTQKEKLISYLNQNKKD